MSMRLTCGDFVGLAYANDDELREFAEEILAKNAKLRELCAGLWNVMWACAEQRCPHRHEDCFVVNGNGDGPKSHGECWYKLRMRELGIEVSE